MFILQVKMYYREGQRYICTKNKTRYNIIYSINKNRLNRQVDRIVSLNRSETVINKRGRKRSR